MDSRIIIIVHSNNDNVEIRKRLIFTTEIIHERSKEIYSKNLFISNIPFYIESKKYNIGLNQKVSIDVNGEIKNYLEHQSVFGNVKTNKIEEVLLNKDFTNKWRINNDKIEKCSECQFRYMCISNSDVLKIDIDKYIKKNTCNFNPIKNIWN